MSKTKRPLKAGENSAPPSRRQFTPEQQAMGIALAGSALSTPLLLALLDKVLTLDEIQTICTRARAIAGNFSDLPEGKFALACLEDFLLARSPLTEDNADQAAPDLVPSDQGESTAKPTNPAASKHPSRLN